MFTNFNKRHCWVVVTVKHTLHLQKTFFSIVYYYYPHNTGKKGKMRQSFATGYSYLWSTRASNPFWCRLRLLLTLVHCVGWGVKRFRSNLIKVPREKKESEQQIVMGSWCFLRRSYSPHFMRWGRGGAFDDYVVNPCETLTGLFRWILDQLMHFDKFFWIGYVIICY